MEQYKFQDVAHIYLTAGIKCQRMGIDGVAVLTGISYDDTQRIWWAYFENEEEGHSLLSDVKPLLRPWSDLKPEEVKSMKWDHEGCYWIKKNKKGVVKILYDEQQPSCIRPNEWLSLTGIGIDLFGLIDSGEALDATIV